MKAAWWRILGKKVRARAQFAPLLSSTAHAYQLWLRNEPPLHFAETVSSPIVAVIAEGPGQEATLNDAATEGLAALLISHRDVENLPRILSDLAGNWLLPLPAGDRLARGAGNVYRANIDTADSTRQPRIIYADDDLIDSSNRRHDPHFKPDWNSELYSHFDYLAGACVVRPCPADFAALTPETWIEDIVRRAVARSETAPIHLPNVLHHRRRRFQPVIPQVETNSVRDWPRVSVIVPTRNRVDLLRNCIDGLSHTDYSDLEIIVVDNGSDDPETLKFLESLDPIRHRILRDDGPFNFSRLNNAAVEVSTGELLCLMNNDIEITNSDWLKVMAQQALRPEVGAVGARLLYPDGRIQHAGVVLGICGGAAHAHRTLCPGDEGYFRRHALPQFVSAVTAACLVVRRESYLKVGGFDEKSFAVAFNDVDLCMRLNKIGLQSFYEPRASLIHHESVSRGLDRDPVGAARLARELAALQNRWLTNRPDIFWDPYHHPNLDMFSEHFAVRVGTDYR